MRCITSSALAARRADDCTRSGRSLISRASMKILVLGGGGREHALAWKLRQSPRVTGVFVAPGNAGTKTLATNVPIRLHEAAELVAFAKGERIDLTVVGPDDALAAGMVDLFE